MQGMPASVPLHPAPAGAEMIRPRTRLMRHRHIRGYIAVVLSGRYQESGDSGRFEVGPGDALVHAPFEAHRNDISAAGAVVLNLPLIGPCRHARCQIADPDALVAVAARDPLEAAAICLEEAVLSPETQADWPDLLARQLRSLTPFRLADWARGHGLAPETVSRGFAQAYGVAPRLYRAEARGRRAIARIRASERPLAEVAAELGFADQAHMTRAVRALSGRTPGEWRRRARP